MIQIKSSCLKKPREGHTFRNFNVPYFVPERLHPLCVILVQNLGELSIKTHTLIFNLFIFNLFSILKEYYFFQSQNLRTDSPM